MLTTEKPLRFDWENKWLRGDQYAHMLNHIDGYRAAFGMHKMAEKQHPENIYLEPESKLFTGAPSHGSLRTRHRFLPHHGVSFPALSLN